MRVLIYDAVETNLGLAAGWRIGSLFYKFDEVIPATSWNQVFEKLLAIPGTIHEIQWWGHGNPGIAVLNGLALNQNNANWPLLKNKLPTNGSGLIWFRCCASFQGEKGKKFALDLANKLNCKVAGHTYNIGFPFHSGLHSVTPLKIPSWSNIEGLGIDGKTKSSSLFAPNTIYMWQDKLPVGY